MEREINGKTYELVPTPDFESSCKHCVFGPMVCKTEWTDCTQNKEVPEHWVEVKMTEKDQALIDKAFEYTDGSDWNRIAELMDQAESDQAYRILKDRQSYLYHKEESFADQL